MVQEAAKPAGLVKVLGSRHARGRSGHRATLGKAPRHEPPSASDPAYAGAEPVHARRLVYRVRFLVPKAFGERPPDVFAAATELTIDVSPDRLRAQFSGPGWPVDADSQVRLRGDRPGVYVFDSEGGRPLGASQLAAWFEGRLPGHQSTTRLGVGRVWGRRVDGPGELTCALFAEWSGRAREGVMGRCRGNAMPPVFVLGPWRGELTAAVALELARRDLAADATRPPQGIRVGSAPFLEPRALGRLQPARDKSGEGKVEPPPAAGPTTLEVVNHELFTVVVVVDGTPVGAVRAQQAARFLGLMAGPHRVGLMRPLGLWARRPRLKFLPHRLTVGSVQE
ncbi:MAG: hypothetical protein MJD61_07895 [Proteobacteria bacterium]|nr:hypothetical protein [Pseudomonadota bacterium]